MIAFRKHALEGTRRVNSFLRRLPHDARTTPRVAASLVLSLAFAANAFASPQSKERAKTRGEGRTVAAKPQTPEQPTPVQSDKPADAPQIPIRVTRVNTPDGPSVIATIGEFPSDLNEAGREFLKREFFEHFASDVMGLGESDAHATLKVALLPQEKENQREGDFTFGKLSGHMVVLVEKRRVLVSCTFSEAESMPQLLAGFVRSTSGRVGAD
jgi:hypothetical protein